LAVDGTATRDGALAAGTWSVKDSASRITVNLSSGFVLDWPAGKTGWIQAGGVPGVAPRKQWNASRAKFERQPADDWKRAARAYRLFAGWRAFVRGLGTEQRRSVGGVLRPHGAPEGHGTGRTAKAAACVVHRPSVGETRQRCHARTNVQGAALRVAAALPA
jgi:hypothetical protein